MRMDPRAPEAYKAAFGAYNGLKQFPPYYTRKWLSLRLSAVKRLMVVDPAVSPAFLERVTEGRCPVTLQPFETKTTSARNPSIDRLVNDVTYRAGNICVLSMRANRAKGDKTFEEVAKLAEAGLTQQGLEGVEWMRLASLMYGAWARAVRKGDPYLLPLAAMPGPSMFTSTSQVLQVLLLRSCVAGTLEGTARAWLEATAAAGAPETLLTTLLRDLQEAVEAEAEHPPNAWLHAHVFDGFVRWYNRCCPVVVSRLESVLAERQRREGDPLAEVPWTEMKRYYSASEFEVTK
jgi:hypothetical protein